VTLSPYALSLSEVEQVLRELHANLRASHHDGWWSVDLRDNRGRHAIERGLTFEGAFRAAVESFGT